MNLKDRLKDKLTKEELSQVVKSFEILGEVVIIQVPESLESKKRIIADAVKEQHKQVKTVLRKIEKVDTEFRIPVYELLIGDSTETIYTESGCRYKLDPTKTFFSEKLGTERLRILEQVTDGEIIHALFAGVGPYPILIAKTKDVKIYAIEKNPEAVRYLKENIILNKVQGKIDAYSGDVKEILPILDIRADRILMPLPKTGEQFLGLALQYIKKQGIIHYYCFGTEQEIPLLREKIIEEGKSNNKKIEILGVYKCGAAAPRVYRVCLDLKIR